MKFIWPRHLYQIFRGTKVASFCSIAVLLFGALSFTGWVIRVPELRNLFSDMESLPPETAIGLAAAALALFLKRRSNQNRLSKMVSDTCALFCIGLGALISLTLLSEGLHFMALGTGLLTINWETRGGFRPAQALAIVGLLMPTQALLSSLYGMNPANAGAYSTIYLFQPSGIATAVCLALLSIGLLFARPHVGVMAVFTTRTLPGKIVRRLLLPALIVPPILGFFISQKMHFSEEQAAFTASLISLAAIMIFVFDLSRNGIELYAVQAQRDQAEIQLKRATHVAEEANRSKSNFLANMSHEIRSPVGVMMGFADLINDPACGEEERAQYIRIMKRNGHALLTIIDDILDLSKVEADKLKIQMTRVDLKALIQDVTLVHTTLAKEKGIRFQSRIDGPLPQAIVTDPVRLRQILTNVLGNAVKFTSHGAVSLNVRTVDSNPSDRTFTLSFEVTDTGCGIKAEHVPKLFQPFMQGDPSINRLYGGSGLGLALSKRLAQVLSGDLMLKETALEKGSTFVLTLTAALPEEIPFSDAFLGASEVPETSSHPDGSLPLQGLRVLVVDDAADNRTLMKWILNHEGAEVELACNGDEAVQKALQGNHHVILMDLQMPVMDGITATSVLRQKGYTRPILALTAHAMKEDRERSLSNGLNDHLSKPIQRDYLVNKLLEFTHTEAAS